MPFSRARYVTLCQQSLVTAAVLAVAVSAAGVKTLDIVPQPAPLAERQAFAPSQPSVAVPPVAPARSTAAAATVPTQGSTRSRQVPASAGSAPVDKAPVKSKVREIEVSGVEAKPGHTPRPQGRTAPAAPAPTAAPTAPTPLAGEEKLVALSAPQSVRGYATVGITWESGTEYAEDGIRVEVRTSDQGVWSDWVEAGYHDDHGPDAAEAAQAGERPGTDALVVGDVDEVQMRAFTTDGVTPPGLKLAVVDPGTGAQVVQAPAIDTAALDAAAAGTQSAPAPTGAAAATEGAAGTSDTVTLSAMKVAPQPYIYSRAQWGANEKLREQTAPGYGTVKAGFIHHTVNANDYTADQVPALLRGIYAYHTQSRGWRDIGYNFLVDRFGRIWEGRWGGVGRAVVGAHTSGYNEASFAMSAIGNFDIANSPQVVADAYAQLFAWKLSAYGIRADATRVYVKNKYFNAISGHRDAGSTACPGRYLYAQLPAIRLATQRLQDAAQAGAPAPQPAKPVSPGTPPYTGAVRTDARCTTAAVSKRAYGVTGATTNKHLLVPLQCLLKQHGFYPYAVTGTWNAPTLAGIRAYQAAVRHPVQSVFSRSDWVSLLTAGTRGGLLKAGTRGADVIRLQRALNAALNRKLPVTGGYNKRTKRAVGIYQSRVGIKRTKMVSTLTWGALRAGRL